MDRSRIASCCLLSFIVLAAFGCASSTPSTTDTAPPPPPPSSMSTPTPMSMPAPMSGQSTSAMADSDMATVYIYRPKSFMGMALQPTVMLDGAELIDVRNGTVWMGKFKPGRYTIQMDDKKTGGEMDLRAGEVYYMRVDIVPGVFKGGGRMTQVTADQGAKDVAKLNPLPAAEVKHPLFKGM